MVRSFWRDSVTVIRPGLIPSAHNPANGKPDWENTTQVTWDRCRVQSGSSGFEDERPLWRYSVYLPVEADVRVGDRIQFVLAGVTVTAPVEDEGPPLVNRGPGGLTGHVRVNVVRAD